MAAKTFNGSEEPEVQAVIRRELKHWLCLRHENILELLAIGDFNFELAALMPLAAGNVAEQTIGKGPIPVLAAVQIVRDAAAGLKFAWTERGILHLDVKPENMLVVRRDRRFILKVSDWGMSSIQSAGSAGETRGGTPPYMAPERFFRDSAQSCSWDIFSLGIALVGFISGQLPFDFREDIPNQLVSGVYLSRAASLLSTAGLHHSARRAALFLIHPDPQLRIGDYDGLEDVLQAVAQNPRYNFPWSKRQPWS